jgi:prepilin-type N-terminal cleavage/methylation domain-containing protein
MALYEPNCFKMGNWDGYGLTVAIFYIAAFGCGRAKKRYLRLLRPLSHQKGARKMCQKKGFTLIELLVVIAILGILALIAIPRITTGTTTAEINACRANQKIINTQIEMYYTDNGYYPAEETWQGEILDNPNYFPGQGLGSPDEPRCPLGGTYSMNPTTHHVSCSLGH